MRDRKICAEEDGLRLLNFPLDIKVPCRYFRVMVQLHHQHGDINQGECTLPSGGKFG